MHLGIGVGLPDGAPKRWWRSLARVRGEGGNMLRRSAVVPVAILLIAIFGQPASALTRVRIPIAITSDPVAFEGFCPFPIEYQDLRGAIFQVLTFDPDGNVVRIDIHGPGLTSQVSANGHSIVFNNAGPITVIPQADGSDLVRLRGNSFEFDQGVLSGHPIAQISSGLVIITSVFDPNSGFNLFITIQSVGPTTDLCAELAP
jgi:hypothetical protein